MHASLPRTVVLLGFELSGQDKQTFAAASPLFDYLVLPARAPERERDPYLQSDDASLTWVHRPRLKRAYEIVVACYLQIVWSLRFAVVPVLAMQGSAQIFSSSKRGADIVLNAVCARPCCWQTAHAARVTHPARRDPANSRAAVSLRGRAHALIPHKRPRQPTTSFCPRDQVAIAFVFQLDEMLYSSMLSNNERRRFEKASEDEPRPLAAHCTPKSLSIAASWGRLLYVLDCAIAAWDYVRALPFCHSKTRAAFAAQHGVATQGPPRTALT